MVRKSIAVLALFGVISTGCLESFSGDLEFGSPTGYIQIDVAKDMDEGDNNGLYVQFAPRNNESGAGEFVITGRHSRIAVPLTMGEAAGKIEIDFFNDYANLRHVFIEAPFAGGKLLVGETSDVIAPLNPTTLNYIVGWRAGNIGHRSGQVRYTVGDNDSPMQFMVALSDGAVGMPDIQGRVQWNLGDKGSTSGLTVGAAAVMGERNTNIGNTNKETVFGVSGDVQFKIDKFSIKGEFYRGENMVDYMGTCGVAVKDDTALKSTGFWGQISFPISDGLMFNGGITTDQNEDDNLAAGPGAIDCEGNTSIYANIIQELSEKTSVGLEVSNWTTDYANGDDGSVLRVQGMLKMKF